MKNQKLRPKKVTAFVLALAMLSVSCSSRKNEEGSLSFNIAVTASKIVNPLIQIAEEKGHVVVFKNNRPKLLVIDLDTEPQIEMTEDEKLEFVAARILREHRAAFEELAKY